MGYERNESTTAAPQPTMAAERIFVPRWKRRRFEGLGLLFGLAALLVFTEAMIALGGLSRHLSVAQRALGIARVSVLLLLAVGSMAFAWACTRAADLCTVRVGVADFGITVLHPERPPRTVLWKEITDIKRRRFPRRLMLQRVALKTRVVIPYGLLEDGNALRELVYTHWRAAREGAN